MTCHLDRLGLCPQCKEERDAEEALALLEIHEDLLSNDGVSRH